MAGVGASLVPCWHLKRAASTTMWCKCPKLSVGCVAVVFLCCYPFICSLSVVNMCMQKTAIEELLWKSKCRVKFGTCREYLIEEKMIFCFFFKGTVICSGAIKSL